MCNHPRVLAVCLNHEFVVFQPLKGAALDLGSIASYKFYFGPPAPPISTVFLDLCIFLIHPTAHPSVTVHRRITSLCCTFSPPPLLELNSFHLYSIHTLHPPASAARLCASRHMPASSAFPASVCPPFSALGLHPGPCFHLGSSTSVVPSVSPVTPPLPPYIFL